MSGCSASAGSSWGRLVVAQPGDAEHVEDEHAVVGDDRPAALRDDRRMRHACLVADGLDVIDDVVGVLLQRVVDARFEVGLRTVVVDAQSAADVEVLEARRPRLPELGVDARGFVQRALDVADVRDLAAEVEVQQLEAVLPCPQRFSSSSAAQDFARRSGRTSSGSRPTTASGRGRGRRA